jgi:hypothetical protein
MALSPWADATGLFPLVLSIIQKTAQNLKEPPWCTGNIN